MVSPGTTTLLTVIVANELVEIDLGIYLVASGVAEAGPEDMAVVNTNVLG